MTVLPGRDTILSAGPDQTLRGKTNEVFYGARVTIRNHVTNTVGKRVFFFPRTFFTDASTHQVSLKWRSLKFDAPRVSCMRARQRIIHCIAGRCTYTRSAVVQIKHGPTTAVATIFNFRTRETTDAPKTRNGGFETTRKRKYFPTEFLTPPPRGIAPDDRCSPPPPLRPRRSDGSSRSRRQTV